MFLKTTVLEATGFGHPVSAQFDTCPIDVPDPSAGSSSWGGGMGPLTGANPMPLIPRKSTRFSRVETMALPGATR